MHGETFFVIWAFPIRIGPWNKWSNQRTVQLTERIKKVVPMSFHRFELSRIANTKKRKQQKHVDSNAWLFGLASTHAQNAQTFKSSKVSYFFSKRNVKNEKEQNKLIATTGTVTPWPSPHWHLHFLRRPWWHFPFSNVGKTQRNSVNFRKKGSILCCERTCQFVGNQHMWATKTNPYPFLWNPGWLIGIPRMGYGDLIPFNQE